MRAQAKRDVAEVTVSGLFVVANWLFRVSLLTFALCLSYVLYVLFADQLSRVTDLGVQNLRTLGLILTVSGALTAATLALLTLEEVHLSVVSGAVGLGMLFGSPVLISAYARVEAYTPGFYAAQELVHYGTLTGKVIMVIVGLRVVYEIYLQLSTEEERRARKQKQKEEASARLRLAEKPKRKYSESVMAKCWDMPFCHDAVREMCPAFKARKTCWRFGRGCNCDPNLVETMIRSRAPSTSRPGTEAEYLRSDLQADAVRVHGERTLPCTKCPIYVEHQRRKFKVMTPILVLVTVVAMFVFYGSLAGLYSLVAQTIASLASGLALGQTGGDYQWWVAYLDNEYLQGSFVVILGLFVITWVLKVTEWLVLDRKIL